MRQGIDRIGAARRLYPVTYAIIVAAIMCAGSVLHAASSMAPARKPVEKIVYRFHSPGDLAKIVETANVKITEDPSGSTIVTYRKPRGTPGSRNYVVEDRPEDSTSVTILTEKDDVLYAEEESTATWAVRSSPTRDSYYVMQHAAAAESAMTREADPHERSIRDDATFGDYSYPYVLVEVVGARAHLFDCMFDTTRMTGPEDRKFLLSSSHGDIFVEPALDRISSFLSERGADTRRDHCTPMKAEPQPPAG